jgi:hypothetical protein
MKKTRRCSHKPNYEFCFAKYGSSLGSQKTPYLIPTILSTAEACSSATSLLTHEGRITVKTFAAVPTLANLPEIQQAPGSVANISSFRGTGGGVDLAEGCILTKSVKYTHQLAHWVTAVRSGDPSEVVSRFIMDYLPQFLNLVSLQERVIEFQLQIIPYREFSLNDPCNLAYRKSEGHTQ